MQRLVNWSRGCGLHQHVKLKLVFSQTSSRWRYARISSPACTIAVQSRASAHAPARLFASASQPGDDIDELNNELESFFGAANQPDNAHTHQHQPTAAATPGRPHKSQERSSGDLDDVAALNNELEGVFGTPAARRVSTGELQAEHAQLANEFNVSSSVPVDRGHPDVVGMKKRPVSQEEVDEVNREIMADFGLDDEDAAVVGFGGPGGGLPLERSMPTFLSSDEDKL